MNWYYGLRGQQVGPMSWNEMVNLVRAGTLAPDTPVWNGEGDWRPASQSNLAQVFTATRPMGPPPLLGQHVDNTFVWAIVPVPLVAVVIEAFDPSAQTLSLVVTVGLNILLAVLDGKRVQAAGHAAPPASWAMLIPVYLWKRATLVKQSRVNFAAWCGAFVLSIGLSTGLTAPETRAHVQCNPVGEAFACSVMHDQGRSTVNVCWDVVLACGNGVRAVGHACQVVAPQGTATRLVPASDIHDLDQCQTVVATTIENLTLTAQ